MPSADLLVVIPTRNRAALAAKAIRSVLDQRLPGVKVLVSDNSTSADEIATLSDFCSAHSSEVLDYIRPPQPLPMASHWEWVIEHALAGNFAYYTFLTDRMIFKKNALAAALSISQKIGDKVVCYMHDSVDDYANPVVIHQNRWTGNVFEVSAAHLLTLAANSVMYDPSFPRMLNCIVPREHFPEIKRRFGSIFESVAPDWTFCFRTLAVVESVVFYDKSVLIHYAADKSNGASQTRGVQNDAMRDFIKDLGSSSLSAMAPIPEIPTVWNTIISEYCSVKAATNLEKFIPINMQLYIEALARGVAWMENAQLRAEMKAILVRHGWTEKEDRLGSVETGAEESHAGIVNKLCHVLGNLTRFLRSDRSLPLWRVLTRLGVHPPDKLDYKFSSSTQALDHIQSHPRFPLKDWREGRPPPELARGARLVFSFADQRRPERLIWKLERKLQMYSAWQALSQALEKHLWWRFQ